MHYSKQIANTLYGSFLLVIMLLIRIIVTGKFTYSFLLWNLFLAFLPLAIALMSSRYFLKSWKLIIMTIGWLLLFPNAPYMVTDLYHLAHVKGMPAWYDALMLFTAASTGIGLAFTSLQVMEKQWSFMWQKKFLSSFSTGSRIRLRMAGIMIIYMLTGFGIYLGRILRYNSWDVVTDSGDLFTDISIRLSSPFTHISTWGFTCVYGGVLFLLYYAWCGSSRTNDAH